MTKWSEYSKLTHFEYIVIHNASFISEYDKEQMSDYIKQFKKLGINTENLDKNIKGFYRYYKIPYEMDMFIRDKDDENIDKLYDEMDLLEPIYNDFINDLKDITIEAKEKINL